MVDEEWMFEIRLTLLINSLSDIDNEEIELEPGGVESIPIIV